MTELAKQEDNNLLSELVQTLVSLIEEKDEFMRGHAQRVASTGVYFSRKLNLSKNDIETIYFAGLLHDIAMVYVPIEIFQKSGELNDDEMALIKKHPIMAERVLSHISKFKGILPIIRHHHEAYDGSGYPDGLKGEKIPFGARLIGIVDSYDAMTSTRSHRPAMSVEEALAELESDVGKRFDGKLVKDFLEFIKLTVGNLKEDTEEEEQGTAQEIVYGIVKRFKSGDVDLPVLPKVVQEVQNVLSQSQTTANDMAKVIEKDTVISVRLISVANSPVYRGTEKIYSVNHAIPRLGFKETRNIVSAIANKGVYQTRNNEFKMIMEKLWLHSLACAYGSTAIATKVGLPDAEHFFLMGLIHDIGKPPLLKLVSEKISPNESMPMADIMASVQKVHTVFGKDILEHWGFPAEFSRIALGHEGQNFSPTTEKEVLVVNLANYISRKIGYSLFDGEVDLAKLNSAKLLGLEGDTLNSIAEEVASTLQKTSHMF